MKIMWRKILIIIMVSLFSLSFVYTEGSAGKSFLWKVDTPKGVNYLLGSIHILKKEHYPLSPAINDAYKNADVLAVEVNLTDPNALASIMKMLQKGSYSGEETIKDNLSAKTYDLLVTKLKELSIDYETIKTKKPWMVAMTILQMELMKLKFNPMYGIDMHFMVKANQDKKKIKELEGAEFQLNLFDGFSRDEGEKFLLSTILEADNLKTELNKMIDTWLIGDAVGMQKILTAYVEQEPALKALMKKINDDRNVGMIKKIDGFFNSGTPHFVIVGAAHLVGPKGILQALKDKGYIITQL
jgi:uncharacterized protein